MTIYCNKRPGDLLEYNSADDKVEGGLLWGLYYAWPNRQCRTSIQSPGEPVLYIIQYCINGPATPAPANTKHLHTIRTTSAQRLRSGSNIVQMLYKCFVHWGVSTYGFTHILN